MIRYSWTLPSIEPGRDFRRAIDDQVASCGVLLAIIGTNWLTARNESGMGRLNDPMDFVRLETASALKRDIPVVPVLVHGARMPRGEDLPEDLKELAFRNGVELTHARWDSDVQVLVKALRPYVQAKREPTPPLPPPAPSEPGPARMIIAVVVGVLLLAIGGYILQRKSSEEAPPGAPRLGEAKRPAVAKEETPKAEADGTNREKIAAEHAARLARENEIAERAKVAEQRDQGAPFFMTRWLTEVDLTGKSQWELDVMRNEIYARHGRRFTRKDLQDYFSSQSWYSPIYSQDEFPPSSLSAIEKRNIAFIAEYQRRLTKGN